MGAYLLDTNILLRASDAGSEGQPLARRAFEMLTARGHKFSIPTQVSAKTISLAISSSIANFTPALHNENLNA